MRILYVEDHADTAFILKAILQRKNHEVILAGTLTAALDAMSRHEFDVVLCDLTLPDGRCEDLAALASREVDTPFIALTGHGEDYYRNVTKGVFRAHLVKPIDIETLERTLEQSVAVM